MSIIVLMTNPDCPHLARAFARPSDDLDLEAQTWADMGLVRRLAAAFEAPEPLDRAEALVLCAAWGKAAGADVAGVIADAARAIAELRLEWGCEDWELITHWSPEVCRLADAHDALCAVRAPSVAQRAAG